MLTKRVRTHTNVAFDKEDPVASHKKHPVFIRVISSNNTVVCINPLQLSSFQIIEKAKIKTKGADGQPADVVADTIRFYFPNGTGLSYSVGVDMSQDEFIYVCNTLREFLYLSEPEFRIRSAELEAARIKEWDDTMASPEIDAEETKAMMTPPVEA